MLDGCRPEQAITMSEDLRAALRKVRTSIKVAEWERALRNHPDREFVEYPLKDMSQGFRIGFNQALVLLKSATRNMML